MEKLIITYILLAFPFLAWCQNITFADAEVKRLCVSNWDSNGDGELSFDEASLVKSIGGVFTNNTEITSFEELKYFTGLNAIGTNGYLDKITGFSGCGNLESIIIPSSVTVIGKNAFDGCRKLKAINIPSSVCFIGGFAFRNCENLLTIDIPSDVTSILEDTFWGCSKLTSVTFPKGLSAIGTYAFSGCSSISRVYLNDIQTWLNIKFEGILSNPFWESNNGHLFVGDEELTDIVIPHGIKEIGYDAFHGCCGISSVSIPQSVISIGTEAFCNCKNLSSVTLPKSLSSIGKRAFFGCSSISRVYLNDIQTWLNIKFEGAASNPFWESNNGHLFVGDEELTDIVIPHGIKEIGYGAFHGCCGLSSVSIPQSVISIGTEAFSNCKNLSSVTIPNSVTSINDNAFNGCENLKNIAIPNSVTTIGNKAFYDCKALTSVTIPNSVEAIGDYMFYGCSGLTSVIIPNSVEAIGDHMFYGCSGLTSVSIPNSVISIGAYAFFGCANLTSVTIPNSVTSIGAHAFDISGLASIVVPNSVESIGDYAFSRCGNLRSCVLPEKLSIIPSMLFWYSTALTSVEMPNNVVRIESGAFQHCENLTSICIPSTVSVIGMSAFYNCKGLTSVHIQDISTWVKIKFANEYSNPLLVAKHLYLNNRELKNVTIPNDVNEIPSNAFKNCCSLISVIIPENVNTIADDAFEGCTSLSALVWETNLPISKDLLKNINNPNFLLFLNNYDNSPSNIRNIIVNDIAKEIVLTGAANSNNFYCPKEFTAEKISYTHKYGMTSGFEGKAQGWESIALPFTVSEITHESKGKLLPFGAWTSTSDAKPFWLCSLSSSGFTRATSIEANTPYIICMPNNSDYDSSFNLSGNVTFSATNVKVPVSSSVTTSKSNSKTFIPAFCAQDKSSAVYALNVNNSYHSELGGYTEGSAFVSGLRKVSPFEAYMTTSDSNAKRAFLIDFNEATGIDELPAMTGNEGKIAIYNLSGQHIITTDNGHISEVKAQLPAGIYIINGKKTVIKR